MQAIAVPAGLFSHIRAGGVDQALLSSPVRMRIERWSKTADFCEGTCATVCVRHFSSASLAPGRRCVRNERSDQRLLPFPSSGPWLLWRKPDEISGLSSVSSV